MGEGDEFINFYFLTDKFEHKSRVTPWSVGSDRDSILPCCKTKMNSLCCPHALKTFAMVSKKNKLFVKTSLIRDTPKPWGDSEKWEKGSIWQNLEAVNKFLGYNCHGAMCVCVENPKTKNRTSHQFVLFGEQK